MSISKMLNLNSTPSKLTGAAPKKEKKVKAPKAPKAKKEPAKKTPKAPKAAKAAKTPKAAKPRKEKAPAKPRARKGKSAENVPEGTFAEAAATMEQPKTPQELKDQAQNEVEAKTIAVLQPTLKKVQIDDIMPPVYDGEKQLERPTMVVMDKLIQRESQLKNQNQAKLAILMFNMQKNGDWKDLGFDSQNEYWEASVGMRQNSVERIVIGLKLLLALGTSPAKVEKAYSRYVYSRLGELAGYAFNSTKSRKEIEADLIHCEVGAKKTAKDFDRDVIAKYKDEKDQRKAKEEEALSDEEKPFKIKGFKVPKRDADTIMAAHMVAKDDQKNPDLPFGAAMTIACGHFITHYGTKLAQLPVAIHSLETLYGIRIVAIPLPDKGKHIQGAPVVKAFEKDGRIILMETKKEAAKVFGVPVGEVNEVQLDIMPYLTAIGYSESMQPAEEGSAGAAPVPIEKMSSKEITQAVSKLKRELGFTTNTWIDFSNGMDVKVQLESLLKLQAEGKTAKDVVTDADEGSSEEPAAEEPAADTPDAETPSNDVFEGPVDDENAGATGGDDLIESSNE